MQAKSLDTGIVQKRQTNADGFYAFIDLQPGPYEIEVNQTGFTTFRQTGILLDVNSAKVFNITLKVGQISEKVEVSTDAVQLDTASTQNGEVIRAQTITAVPLVTRSYTDLLALQPGVTPVSSGLAGGQGGQFSATGFTFNNVSGDLNAGNLSVNGQRESANGFLLNGTTVQEFAFSGAGMIPNLDSIAEFRIVTNNFDAEYGNYAGGQINVITKSGTNRFHGSAFEFLRNRSFDATRYFTTTQDDHKQNEFGGTVGGPILHDKLFFFGDYQGNRVIQGQSGSNGLTAVPTEAERRGDFSALTSSLTGTVQGPAWAQQLSDTLGYAVHRRRELLHAWMCKYSHMRLPGRANSNDRVDGTFPKSAPVYSSGKCGGWSILPHRRSSHTAHRQQDQRPSGLQLAPGAAHGLLFL